MSVDEQDLTKQYQRYTDRHGRPVGDCWRTAIACLMEVPRDTVPHFADDHEADPEGSLGWWNDTVLWVEENRPGWTLICTAPDFPVYATPKDAPKIVALSGGSPRGEWNHVILVDAETGEYYWDPMPNGNGELRNRREIFALAARKDYE